MNDEIYLNFLENQARNIDAPAMQVYSRYLYSLIEKELWPDSHSLEIGAGAGISKIFLPTYDVLRTDLLAWPAGEVIGGINAKSLPYSDNTFDTVIGVDALHHLDDPHACLIEFMRVLRPNGKIILIEPYVSLLSFPVFKLFHTEKTSWWINRDELTYTSKLDASEGNQVVSKILFGSKKRCSRTAKEILQPDLTAKIFYFSPLSFFMTGGLTRPLPTPKFLIQLMIRCEELIPQKVRKFFSARVKIVLTKPA